MGSFAVPRPIREYILESENGTSESRMDSAIFYSQDFSNETINRERAAKILVGQVEQAARYDGELAESVHKQRESSYLAGYQQFVNQYIESSKARVLEEFEASDETESLPELQNRLFFEIWAYRVEGVKKTVTKFLGVLTLDELRIVEEYLRNKGLKNQKRLNRVKAIIAKMEAAGCEGQTTVQDFVRTASV